MYSATDNEYLKRCNIWMAQCELRDAKRMRNNAGYTAGQIAQALHMAAYWRNLARHFSKQVSALRKGGGVAVDVLQTSPPVCNGDRS